MERDDATATIGEVAGMRAAPRVAGAWAAPRVAGAWAVPRVAGAWAAPRVAGAWAVLGCKGTTGAQISSPQRLHTPTVKVVRV